MMWWILLSRARAKNCHSTGSTRKGWNYYGDPFYRCISFWVLIGAILICIAFVVFLAMACGGVHPFDGWASALGFKIEEYNFDLEANRESAMEALEKYRQTMHK